MRTFSKSSVPHLCLFLFSEYSMSNFYFVSLSIYIFDMAFAVKQNGSTSDHVIGLHGFTSSPYVSAVRL